MAGTPRVKKCACKRPLYRRMDDGMVAVTDKFVWCRNQSCKKYNIPQGHSRFHSIPQVTIAPLPKQDVDVGKVVGDVLADLLPKPVVAKTEPEGVTNARARISSAIKTLEQTYPRKIICLALAIVAQEIGSFGAANELIVEHELETAYGILPRKS